MVLVGVRVVRELLFAFMLSVVRYKVLTCMDDDFLRPCRVTVSGGKFTATVPSRSALGIHTGQKGSGSGSGGGGGGNDGSVAVAFAETAQTVFGENIFLAGSIPQLGNWDPNAAVRYLILHFFLSLLGILTIYPFEIDCAFIC
jgi:hypothetical protein